MKRELVRLLTEHLKQALQTIAPYKAPIPGLEVMKAGRAGTDYTKTITSNAFRLGYARAR